MTAYSVKKNIARAKTSSTDVCTSAEAFVHFKEKKFAPSKQFAGDTDRFLERKSCFPFILLERDLNKPLLLIHDEKRKIRCLSNVCTHHFHSLLAEFLKLN